MSEIDHEIDNGIDNDAATPAAPYRRPSGGRIDRGTTLRFTFGERALTGHPGDTLASALLAHGVHQTSTSIKLGRPRGIAAAWAEDPNSLVQVEEPFPEPMLLATTIELTDGLAAHGIPGQGRLAEVADSARYDARHVHADLLVVGAGPTGLTAAADGRAGGRARRAGRRAVRGGRLAPGHRRARRRLTRAGLGPPGHRRAGGLPRGAAPAAHHGVRALRRRLRPRTGAAHRPPRCLRTAPPVAAARLAHPRPARARRGRRARASCRVRRQRPPRHHARRRRPHVPAPLRRAGRPRGRRVHHRRQRLRRGGRPRRRRGRGARRRRRAAASRPRTGGRRARAAASRSAPARS